MKCIVQFCAGFFFRKLVYTSKVQYHLENNNIINDYIKNLSSWNPCPYTMEQAIVTSS